MDRIKNARVLVTGGAGFIGSHLCRSLLEHGNEVHCMDNFATGSRENLKDISKNKNFKLIEADIRNASACIRAMGGIDIVLHQAALGSVPRSVKDPLTTHDVNVNGFLNV